MREIPYSSLRFKNAPVRRRIFWSTLIGLFSSYFVGGYLLSLQLFVTHSMNLFVAPYFRSHQFQIYFSVFLGSTLFIHLIMLSIERPRFQFSLLRLLLTSIVIALFFSANLIPYTWENDGRRVVGATEMTMKKEYGWPLPLREIRLYNTGQVNDIWHRTSCIVSAALLLLTILNILLIKLPRSSPPQDHPEFPSRSKPQT